MNYNSLLFVIFGIGIFIAVSLIGYCGELYMKQKKNVSERINETNVEDFNFEIKEENIDVINNNDNRLEQDMNVKINNDELLDEYDDNIKL